MGVLWVFHLVWSGNLFFILFVRSDTRQNSNTLECWTAELLHTHPHPYDGFLTALLKQLNCWHKWYSKSHCVSQSALVTALLLIIMNWSYTSIVFQLYFFMDFPCSPVLLTSSFIQASHHAHSLFDANRIQKWQELSLSWKPVWLARFI